MDPLPFGFFPKRKSKEPFFGYRYKKSRPGGRLFRWLRKGEPRRTGLILDYYRLPVRQRPPSVRAEREARRVARAQRLAEGPSTAALALRKAQRWQKEIGSRGLRRADIARAEGITRARVTQVMGLLALPADLQRDLTDNKPYTRSWSIRHALEMAAV